MKQPANSTLEYANIIKKVEIQKYTNTYQPVKYIKTHSLQQQLKWKAHITSIFEISFLFWNRIFLTIMIVPVQKQYLLLSKNHHWISKKISVNFKYSNIKAGCEWVGHTYPAFTLKLHQNPYYSRLLFTLYFRSFHSIRFSIWNERYYRELISKTIPLYSRPWRCD